MHKSPCHDAALTESRPVDRIAPFLLYIHTRRASQEKHRAVSIESKIATVARSSKVNFQPRSRQLRIVATCFQQKQLVSAFAVARHYAEKEA
jgi:hypothetical protein